MIQKHKTVCFTGHRNIEDAEELKKTLTKLLVKLIDEGATDFYVGGAIGFDMLCENTVIELRECFPHIKLHLILPCSAEEQTAKWSDSDKIECNRLLSAANTVEICTEHYSNGCMKARNQRLVEYADVCVCYFNENNKRSGTGQTVRMAIKKGIDVINLYCIRIVRN